MLDCASSRTSPGSSVVLLVLISSLLLSVWNSLREYWHSSVVGHDRLSTGSEKVIAYCLLRCIAFRSQWIRNFLLTQWWYRNPLLITLLLTYLLFDTISPDLPRATSLSWSIHLHRHTAFDPIGITVWLGSYCMGNPTCLSQKER